ncbi:MAG: hypothetical protein GQ570_04015 [Helicobacteraceae bacterium]|nr:hypothetical protein [Helicobacteraceae bacterium]
MTTNKNNNIDVAVERDGIKLGWNVLALIASVGLGFYVSAIITPITRDVATLMTDHKATQKVDEVLNAEIIRLQGRINFLESHHRSWANPRSSTTGEE